MMNALSTAQLEELHRSLATERTRILRILGPARPSAPQADQVSEVEEAAQRTRERTHDLELERVERLLLVDVERALAKLRAGEYGLSETSGAPIPFERLAILPWARQRMGE